MLLTSVRQMLDLPATERSAYLAKIPLSVEYVFDVMEASGLTSVRRIIHRHGGVWSEHYRSPGVFFQATFASPKMKRECSEEIIALLNAELREFAATDEWFQKNPEELENMLYTMESFPRPCLVPTTEYYQDNWIDEDRILIRYEGPFHLEVVPDYWTRNDGRIYTDDDVGVRVEFLRETLPEGAFASAQKGL